jgi:hypothetical protein
MQRLRRAASRKLTIPKIYDPFSTLPEKGSYGFSMGKLALRAQAGPKCELFNFAPDTPPPQR